MKRKLLWAVVFLATWGSGLAMAQQPFGYPGNGYPGVPAQPMLPQTPYPPGYPYATLPQLPMAPGTPMAPYGPTAPAAPQYPYGAYPMPPKGPAIPNAPYLVTPNGPAAPLPPGGPRPPIPPSGPAFNGPPPRPAASEPYVVPPSNGSTYRDPMPGGSLPEVKPNVGVIDRLVEFVTGDSGEPTAVYEGRRYPAEMRHDNTYHWIQANYIHWWVRRDNTPPLVSTGDPTVARTGAIGNPDTVVLLGGGSSVGPKEFSGAQMTLGMWLDPERLQSLEIGGFWVGKNSRTYRFGGDATGNPALVQPLQFPDEGALAFSFPGQFSGTMTVHTVMDFHNLELNVARNVFRINCWSLDTLVGVRYMYMNDQLSINQNVTVLPGAAGFIPFLGTPQPAGSNFVFNDSFDVTNRFYGGTVGARVNFVFGCFDLSGSIKVSLGATAHVANIDGTTTLNLNGTSTTVSGGSVAQASNIGRYTNTDFSVVSEFNTTLGYQLTPGIRLMLGYNFLDWSKTLRAGNQIDRQVDFVTVPSQVPTSPTFAPGTVGTRPAYTTNRSDFWAQGITVGIELKY